MISGLATLEKQLAIFACSGQILVNVFFLTYVIGSLRVAWALTQQASKNENVCLAGKSTCTI